MLGISATEAKATTEAPGTATEAPGVGMKGSAALLDLTNRRAADRERKARQFAREAMGLEPLLVEVPKRLLEYMMDEGLCPSTDDKRVLAAAVSKLLRLVEVHESARPEGSRVVWRAATDPDDKPGPRIIITT
jgi:hypothetical protein